MTAKSKATLLVANYEMCRQFRWDDKDEIPSERTAIVLANHTSLLLYLSKIGHVRTYRCNLRPAYSRGCIW